jgi:hypothetical protein
MRDSGDPCVTCVPPTCLLGSAHLSGGWSERSLPLATVLLTPWALWQGAADEIIERAKEEGDDDVLTDGGNALEVSRGC